jgi:hypothetical protein
MQKLRTIVRRILLGLLALLLAVAGFVVWAEVVPAPEAAALRALVPDEAVIVEQGRWLVFTPAGQAPETGLILYPGGRVDARAYALAARAIAEAGYRVVVVPMPLHLAVLAPNRAAEVIAAYPEVRAWAVGGHSLGGAMAAHFAASRPRLVRGLVLWAAYPAASDDLSGLDLIVASIYGTRDGVAGLDDLEAAAGRLPPDTRWVAVEGGNHAQFGRYGPQAGDNTATITAEAQQAAVVEATVELMTRVRAGMRDER